MRTAIMYSVTILLATSVTAGAQDHPGAGFVYNTTGSDVLQYDCSKDRGELLCKFIQIRVRHKLTAEEARKRLEIALGEFGTSADSQPDKKTCDQMSETASAIRDGNVPPGVDRQQYLSETSKMDADTKARTLRFLELFATFCNEQSEQNYAALLKYGSERDRRTCVISAHPYSQRFQHFPATGNWNVRQDGPEGSCGIVNVSRFEPDNSRGNYTFWNYHAQKVVTNKGGQSPLLPCADFDEGAYQYQWQSRTVSMMCETVEFAPF